MSLIEHFLCGITIVSIIFLLVFLPLIPAEEQETIFMQECIAKGGVPKADGAAMRLRKLVGKMRADYDE